MFSNSFPRTDAFFFFGWPFLRSLALGLLVTWLIGVAMDDYVTARHTGSGMEPLVLTLPPIAAPIVHEKQNPQAYRQTGEIKAANVAALDKRFESTVLGFEKSVAPWPGRTVSFQEKQYQVTKVEEASGGPLLFGNGWVIGVLNSSLIVSLKELEPPEVVHLEARNTAAR